MLKTFHPTKRLLVETVMELMETKSPREISADEILSKSGISKGSMYHHFVDLDELIETAQVARFSKWVDVSISNLGQILQNAQSKEDLIKSLEAVTAATQSASRRSSRIERASALSRRNASKNYYDLIGKESDRLMDSLEDLSREAQEKGLFSRKHNPRVIALMVQAYTLGKIVDDYSHKPIPESEWNAIVMDVIRNVFVSD